jgi:ABC-type sugar transport system permease subunit
LRSSRILTEPGYGSSVNYFKNHNAAMEIINPAMDLVFGIGEKEPSYFLESSRRWTQLRPDRRQRPACPDRRKRSGQVFSQKDLRHDTGRDATPQPGRFHLSPRARQHRQLSVHHAWLIHLVVLIGMTMVISLGISFFDTDFLTQTKFVGLQNYNNLLRPALLEKPPQHRITPSSRCRWASSLRFTIALLLNQKVKGLGGFRLSYYVPSIVSGVAVAIIWQYVLNPRYGLMNQALAAFGIKGPQWLYSQQWAMPAFIIMGVWGAGASMLLYLAGLQGIPTQLYDAAKIDGANARGRFRAVTIPMLTPTILFQPDRQPHRFVADLLQSYLMTQGPEQRHVDDGALSL